MKAHFIMQRLLTFSLILATLPLFAQWSTDPAENTLVSPIEAVGHQAVAAMSSDSSRGAIIVWQGGQDRGIVAQRLDINGYKYWQANGVEVCDISHNPGGAQISRSGIGAAIIAWEDARNGGATNNTDIYAQRIDAEGNIRWQINGIPICNLEEKDADLSIAACPDGSAVIVWDSGRTIRAQRVDASGNVLWGVNGIEVVTTESSQFEPQVIAVDDRTAIVVWRDKRNSPSGDIYAQRLDYEYSTVFRIWTDQGKLVSTGISDCYCTLPVITATTEIGAPIEWGAAIGWHESTQAGNSLKFQKLNHYGQKSWGDDGATVCNNYNEPMNYQLISDCQGGAFVTWQDNLSGDDDVFVQRMGEYVGQKLWGNDGISLSTAPGSQGTPQIISDGDQGAIICWADQQSGYGWCEKIYAQKMDNSGTKVWGEQGVLVCSASQFRFPAILCFDGYFGAILAWSDSRTGDSYSDVYAQKINKDGMLGVTVVSECLTETGRISIPVETPLKVHASGDYVYIADCGKEPFDGAFYVVDVSDKTSPSLRDSIPNVANKNIHAFWYANKYAYTTHDWAVKMISVADPDNIEIVGSGSIGFSSGGLRTYGDYLYVGEQSIDNCYGGVRVFDVYQGPLNEVGYYQGKVDGSVLCITHDGSVMYQSSGASPWPPEEIAIYDLSDKTSPALHSTFNSGYMANCMEITFDDRYLFMTVGPEDSPIEALQIWDISDKFEPQLISTYSCSFYSFALYEAANLLFASNLHNTSVNHLWLLDVSDKANIHSTEFLPGLGGALSIDNGYLYIGDQGPNSHYLRVYEIDVSLGTPALSVSPDWLCFGSYYKSKSFSIRNTGSGTLVWSVIPEPGKSWITSISPTSGTGDGTVTVTVDNDRLDQCSDLAKITFTSNAGDKNVVVVICKPFMCDETVTTIAVNPETTTTIFAGTDAETDAHIYKSIDGGQTWEPTSFFHTKSIAINPQTPNIIYAGLKYGGIDKSTDAGMTWERLNGGPADLGGIVAVDPVQPNIVYAGTKSLSENLVYHIKA
ncbi:hypothetical protein JXJ21_00725 [candidate division KSB1 bacterium]|nr:hypothetical protein [candidate division KSB1 bacterium]